MSRYHIQPAKAQDNASILELIAIPMPGLITLAMERAPDYFLGANVQNQEPEIFTCKDSKVGNQLVGLFSVGKRQVYVEGEKQWVRYFSDLRIHPDYQHTLVLMRMIQFVRSRQIMEPGEFAQTVVFSDNAIMQQLIDKTHSASASRLNLPLYRPAGEYITHTIALTSRNISQTNSSVRIRKAEPKDLKEIQIFHQRIASKKQFYPVYDYAALNSPYYLDQKVENLYLAYQDEKIVGITGVWDQKSYKQTKIVDYQPALKLLRPIANIFSPFPLPKVGSVLPYFSLQSILIERNDPAIFRALIHVIIRNYLQQEYAYFLCGLDARDPLNEAFTKMKAQRIVRGRHFLVSLDDGALPDLEKLFYLEVGRI